MSASRSRCCAPYTPMRPRRSGGGSRRMVWYSRKVRTGTRAWAARPSTSRSIGETLTHLTVTVNTVTVNSDGLADQLLAVLRSVTGSPSLAYARAPVPLTGGFWVELFGFSLGQPAA